MKAINLLFVVRSFPLLNSPADIDRHWSYTVSLASLTLCVFASTCSFKDPSNHSHQDVRSSRRSCASSCRPPSRSSRPRPRRAPSTGPTSLSPFSPPASNLSHFTSPARLGAAPRSASTSSPSCPKATSPSRRRRPPTRKRTQSHCGPSLRSRAVRQSRTSSSAGSRPSSRRAPRSRASPSRTSRSSARTTAQRSCGRRSSRAMGSMMGHGGRTSCCGEWLRSTACCSTGVSGRLSATSRSC